MIMARFTTLFLVFLTHSTISISLGHGNSDVLCIGSEREALLSFKQDLVDSSGRLSSWAVDEDCCKWAGIVCHNLTGHVKELHLGNTPFDYSGYGVTAAYYKAEYEAWERSRLNGTINPSLLNLKHLSHLDLSYNYFGRIKIPSFIGSLVSLKYLNLTSAGFAGMIPHQLGNLSSLHHLGLRSFDLYANNLHWLHGLSSLEHLDLSYVNLSKASEWLLEVNNLPSLVELRLVDCELDHIHSLHDVNFTSLSILDISYNYFNSFIPKWVFSLHNLIYLRLSENNFKGPIPNSFCNLTSLRSLDISRNNLNSSLSDCIFNLNTLLSLDLSGNSFHSIPCGFQNMSALRNLDMSRNHFNSTIPNCLYRFGSVKSLNLYRNNLKGVISSAIENLSSLVSLDLSYNELEGEIPTSTGNMSSLVSLHLSSNKLKGEIPSSMGNLCNLEVIDFSSNKLGGKVSEAFESFSGCLLDVLKSLYLGGNKFFGQLTDQIGEFKNLSVLSLSENLISGPIPTSLGQWSSLRSLYIYDNQLNGSLPKSLGRLSNLEELYISSNRLEGVVSEVHFASLVNLNVLSASGNSLTLRVSPDWIPPPHLQDMYLSSWNLGPQFPTWLKSRKSLAYIDISKTNISDIIPSWFWDLSFESIDLSHNQISGKIPNGFGVSQNEIFLGSNKFNGLLPRPSSNLTALDLSNNSFSGNLSHFLCDWVNVTYSLYILHLEGNILSGEIPDCWSNWPSLELINLGSNKLTGKIPLSIGYLQYLNSLHLHNNNLFGELPSTLQNCTELVTLELGANAVTGSIPTWMGINLSKLKVLVLRSNKFVGHIPSELCHLTSLQIMDAASNNFSGTIPRCFNNFTGMATQHNLSETFADFHSYRFIEIAFLWIKGRENQYDTILQLVASLDLSNNNLSGEIPEELTSLVGLISLNLSGNYLTGKIPEKIGEMVWMESLDLSRNQLSGKIPLSMSSLSLLSYLNLSYNNLSGEIPLSTQLQSLNASSFVGNNLCGLPLTKDCGLTGATPSTEHGGKKEGDGAKVDGFYLSLAVGYVVGFWGIFGPLLYSKSWRVSYYRFLDSMKYKVLG